MVWCCLLFKTFFGDFCFVVYFCSPSTSNTALNMIAPQLSSWRCVKVYGGVGACKTFLWCVKELSLKQVGVNSCEPFMSLTDMYINIIHISPHPTLGEVCGSIVLSEWFQAWKRPQSHFWHHQLQVIDMTVSHFGEKGGKRSSRTETWKGTRRECWERFRLEEKTYRLYYKGCN